MKISSLGGTVLPRAEAVTTVAEILFFFMPGKGYTEYIFNQCISDELVWYVGGYSLSP